MTSCAWLSEALASAGDSKGWCCSSSPQSKPKEAHSKIKSGLKSLKLVHANVMHPVILDSKDERTWSNATQAFLWILQFCLQNKIVDVLAARTLNN